MSTDAACPSRADDHRLASRTIAVADIGAGLRDAMFALFAQYYDGVSRERFDRDLDGKDRALLLEQGRELIGFTTLRCFDFTWRGESVSVVFSGDTIVARQHWGEQELARAWLRQIGRIARACGGKRLFWFLIVKGHRTYRYLPAFARGFVPAASGEAPAGLRDLRDALGEELFGPAFDAPSGLVRFAASHGHLASQWAEPSERERTLRDVAFFLAANPGYARGDELACLCELARDNMRPRARRWFDEGYHGG